jgi:hypothetical protein
MSIDHSSALRKLIINMGVFELARINPTSIGYLNATQNLHLLVNAFKMDQQ